MHYNGLLVVTCLDYWVASCMVYFRLTRRSQPSVEAGGDERVACCLIVWGVSCGCKYVEGTQSFYNLLFHFYNCSEGNITFPLCSPPLLPDLQRSKLLFSTVRLAGLTRRALTNCIFHLCSALSSDPVIIPPEVRLQNQSPRISWFQTPPEIEAVITAWLHKTILFQLKFFFKRSRCYRNTNSLISPRCCQCLGHLGRWSPELSPSELELTW